MAPPLAILLLATCSAADLPPCRDCHPRETAAFLASPMGRSFAAAEPSAPQEFRDGDNRFTAAGQTHTITRSGIRAEHPTAYQIGSGQHAIGFLTRIAGELFQSPIAQYPHERRFGLAPGYERLTHPDFNRRVSAECLLCHTNGASSQAPAAISCERCHGPADAHRRSPSKHNIVQPLRLAPPQRDSVCEQCHLAGETRIAHPGQSIAAYQPGARLEHHFTAYVYDQPRGDLRVISHVEQLARSRCSPRLTCTTCHAVHGERIQVNRVCATCHQTKQATHPTGENCTGCHMPRRPVSDGAHTVFTDHRIAARPAAPAANTPPNGLRAWREPDSPALRQRNLGLALIAVGERDQRSEWIQQGYKQLRAVFPSFERDPDVLAAIGMVLFLKDQHKDAAKLLQAAIANRPKDAALHERLAAIQRASGDPAGAARSLEKAIALDPLRETSYHLLHQIRPESNALRRYLDVNPQSIIAREALRR